MESTGVGPRTAQTIAIGIEKSLSSFNAPQVGSCHLIRLIPELIAPLVDSHTEEIHANDAKAKDTASHGAPPGP
jgi:hypothetical protein